MPNLRTSNARAMLTAALLLASGCERALPDRAAAPASVAGASAPLPAPALAAGTSGAVAANPASACAATDATADPRALHAAALPILNSATTCGFDGGCHAASAKGKLILRGIPDLRAALVGKPSCQLPNVPLIDGSGGDAALRNSWLWLKLTAPADASGVLTPNPAWGQPSLNCSQEPSAPVGVRMPRSNTDMQLAADKLAKLRSWICAGAPGP